MQNSIILRSSLMLNIFPFALFLLVHKMLFFQFTWDWVVWDSSCRPFHSSFFCPHTGERIGVICTFLGWPGPGLSEAWFSGHWTENTLWGVIIRMSSIRISFTAHSHQHVWRGSPSSHSWALWFGWKSPHLSLRDTQCQWSQGRFVLAQWVSSPGLLFRTVG